MTPILRDAALALFGMRVMIIIIAV